MFGGIGPATKALTEYVTGMINPFTLAAAAVAGLGAAYYQGSKEADNYAKAIILTGNAAGATVGNLQLMAQRVSDVVGTQHQASEALASLVTAGNVAPAAMMHWMPCSTERSVRRTFST